MTASALQNTDADKIALCIGGYSSFYPDAGVSDAAIVKYMGFSSILAANAAKGQKEVSETRSHVSRCLLPSPDSMILAK